jgi:hypothetical protein
MARKAGRRQWLTEVIGSLCEVISRKLRGSGAVVRLGNACRHDLQRRDCNGEQGSLDGVLCCRTYVHIEPPILSGDPSGRMSSYLYSPSKCARAEQAFPSAAPVIAYVNDANGRIPS